MAENQPSYLDNFTKSYGKQTFYACVISFLIIAVIVLLWAVGIIQYKKDGGEKKKAAFATKVDKGEKEKEKEQIENKEEPAPQTTDKVEKDIEKINKLQEKL